ncbi:hypothetical protein JCM3775_000363 [Rhodotorula graminis]|uniref:Uncharacterized protein n=1 Tax=Rhodotorula graminis (strain WP1) TaxID=578459 RepID=A0A194S9D9_RHOGW|nr:uncharacterized protein RHOBADRAFT_52150 [Rhodotorula graminis WP1]KPV77212.1 hypothetical protein RHOBADRAFT_52150 [Rhodotorula graminis WP1]
MPWAYAVPLGLGLVAVAAVAVILIEVVPAVLEERARERHRRRRLARPVRHRVETPPPAYRDVAGEDSARTSGVEVEDGGWKYEVRRRKGTATTRAAGHSDAAEQGRYRLEPLYHEPQHVLGDSTTAAESDFALGTHDDTDDEAPVESDRKAPSRASSSSSSEPGTAPLVSPTLSTSSRLDTDVRNVTSSAPPAITPPPVEENPFADLASSTAPLPLTSSPLDTASPALSCSSFRPISPIPTSPVALAPVAATSKSASPASADEWVLPSPAPSAPASVSGDAAADTDVDDDGWSRLSDEEDEWREARAPTGETGGLRLEGMAGARAQ